MKRFALALCAALGLLWVAESAWADWGSLNYGGHQPWWNLLGRRHSRHLTCEEKRLQRFWHDYYDALQRYYGNLDRIDWVAYYKNHGYQINCGPAGCGPSGCQRIQFAPVFVSPTMQWAMPSGCMPGGACPPGMSAMLGGGQ